MTDQREGDNEKGKTERKETEATPEGDATRVVMRKRKKEKERKTKEGTATDTQQAHFGMRQSAAAQTEQKITRKR